MAKTGACHSIIKWEGDAFSAAVVNSVSLCTDSWSWSVPSYIALRSNCNWNYLGVRLAWIWCFCFRISWIVGYNWNCSCCVLIRQVITKKFKNFRSTSNYLQDCSTAFNFSWYSTRVCIPIVWTTTDWYICTCWTILMVIGWKCLISCWVERSEHVGYRCRLDYLWQAASWWNCHVKGPSEFVAYDVREQSITG